MNDDSVILRTLMRPLYWVVVIASIWILLRGHNAPGGGFIGGLVVTTATVGWAIAFGPKLAERKMPTRSAPLLGALGIAVAIASGVLALAWGQPFLTNYWWDVPLGVTSIKISTVYFFDLGVYLCVWGALGGYALRLLERFEHENDGDAS